MKLMMYPALLAGNHNYINYCCTKLSKKLVFAIACLLCHCAAFCQHDTINKKLKIIYGVASFYSKHLEGVKTATGEIFHHSQLVAASNNFKLNTWVRITNVRNGKSVIVRINDRMSKAMRSLGRVADVTISAAQRLDFINRGLARVKVEEVPKGTKE